MSMTPHWSADRSLRLSVVCTWVALVGAAAAGVAAPFLPEDFGPVNFDRAGFVRYAPSIYLCLAIGLVALVVLLRLLTDIARGEVFTLANVRRIRAVSWAAVAIGVVCVVSALALDHRASVVLIGLAAAFCGLVARVIKNVVDTARLLKEDSDFTI
ncbi:MAG: DUF2975 domain-containing protein [Propionibacteriaceae bacterium]|jgi:amino acid permease|nr:DUF2975 domain-containing protein [Propionibacteriaceae bacterium]